MKYFISTILYVTVKFQEANNITNNDGNDFPILDLDTLRNRGNSRNGLKTNNMNNTSTPKEITEGANRKNKSNSW